jgi:hypothetical protein
MQIEKMKTWTKFQLMQPLGRSCKSIGFGLLFGMMPILITWLVLSLLGLFTTQYPIALAHGDVLMVATSLAGPAMIAIYRKRDPETIGQPEIVGTLGIILILICAVAFAVINTAILSTELLASKLTMKMDVVRLSWFLLAVSTVYALYVEFHGARSESLQVYRDLYTREQRGIEEKLNFPGGAR